MIGYRKIDKPNFLPCPFCGGIKIRYCPEYPGEENAYVCCDNDDCAVRMYHNTTEELVDAWNKRHELVGVLYE